MFGWGWKWTSKIIYLHPLLWAGHLPQSQVAPSPVQPGISKYGAATASLANCARASRPSSQEEFPPKIPSNAALWQWETIPSCLATPGPCPRLLYGSPRDPLALEGAVRWFQGSEIMQEWMDGRRTGSQHGNTVGFMRSI